jgi:hypothetical protein
MQRRNPELFGIHIAKGQAPAMTPLRLTWSDLFVDDMTPYQFRHWLSPWRGMKVGSVPEVSKFRAEQFTK